MFLSIWHEYNCKTEEESKLYKFRCQSIHVLEADPLLLGEFVTAIAPMDFARKIYSGKHGQITIYCQHNAAS